MLSRLNTGFDQGVDGVMRKMRWREVCGEPPASRLRHQQRVETRYPVVSFVVRVNLKRTFEPRHRRGAFLLSPHTPAKASFESVSALKQCDGDRTGAGSASAPFPPQILAYFLRAFRCPSPQARQVIRRLLSAALTAMMSSDSSRGHPGHWFQLARSRGADIGVADAGPCRPSESLTGCESITRRLPYAKEVEQNPCHTLGVVISTRSRKKTNPA